MKTILQIILSEDGQKYSISASEGVSFNEVMFGMAATIRCFVRDGVIKSPEEATTLLNRYLNDEQFAEVKEVKNESN